MSVETAATRMTDRTSRARGPPYVAHLSGLPHAPAPSEHPLLFEHFPELRHDRIMWGIAHPATRDEHHVVAAPRSPELLGNRPHDALAPASDRSHAKLFSGDKRTAPPLICLAGEHQHARHRRRRAPSTAE